MSAVTDPFLEGRPAPNQPVDQGAPDPQPPVDLDLETPPASTNGHIAANGHRPRRTPQANATQPPPHDTTAERALLGAALIGAVDTLEQVPAAAFYTPTHGHIARAIIRLHQAGHYVDTVTVRTQLDADGLLDQVGGTPALAELLADAPATSAAPSYARIVLDHHQARTLQQAGEEIARAATERGPDAARQIALRLLETLPPPTDATTVPTLAEFLDVDEDDHVWAIPGLLETTDRMLLTGPEGGGKSTLLRQIAVQAAAGIHPFTLETIPALRVLLLDLENSSRHIRRQIRPLHTAAHHQAAHALHVASLPAGLDLTDPVDATHLEHLVASTGAQLIIGGPVYKLVGGDPTEEGPAKAAALLIDRLRDRYQCAWILETHQPHENGGKRPDRPYGASLWKRWPEFGLHLADGGQLRHWRGDRDQRDWPAALQRGGEWPWTLAPRADNTFARVMELCRNAGRMLSYRDLGQQMGASKSQIDRMVKANEALWNALRVELEGEDF